MLMGDSYSGIGGLAAVFDIGVPDDGLVQVIPLGLELGPGLVLGAALFSASSAYWAYWTALG